MLTPLIQRFRRRRGRPARPGKKTLPALTLVEASFDEGGPAVRLGFDRAIDIGALVAAQVTVDAGNVTGSRYVGAGAGTMDGPNAVVIALFATVPSGSADTLLSASAGNGIVAIGDAGTWPGVTELVLPYP